MFHVKMRRHPTIAAAGLLSLAVVLSLGSVTDASVAAAIVSSRALTVQGLDGGDDVRGPSRWFQSLSDSARRLHAQQRCAGEWPFSGIAVAVVSYELSHFNATDPARPRAVILSAHRVLDLPPPRA